VDRLVLLLCKIKFNGEKFEYFATCETYEYGLNIILTNISFSKQSKPFSAQQQPKNTIISKRFVLDIVCEFWPQSRFHST